MVNLAFLMNCLKNVCCWFFCKQVSLYSPSQSSGRELYLLRRVQEAEEELTASHDLIQHLKTTSLQKEKEMEVKILEKEMHHDKELFRLTNYILHTLILY